ncbi:MAG: hypothetical protein IJ678_09005, partial [Kiritimatiellae bacterium]|nr:hypothetical protein [Kiritimatiellia bacterium]
MADDHTACSDPGAARGAARRFATPRAFAFGLAGVLLVSGLAPFHDSVFDASPMLGTQLPVGAFAYFMFVGVLWNGLWSALDRLFRAGGRLRARFCPTQAEFAVAMAATLMACFPPTSGLFRYFHRQLMLPWYYLPSHLDWQAHGLLADFLRPELFPDPWPGDPAARQLPGYRAVYEGFFTGLAKGSGVVPLSSIPFRAWWPPMLYWAPLLVAMSVALVSLQYIVHRQWSRNEQLSYPVAQVAEAFYRRRDGRPGVPDLFRAPLFWAGFLPVFCFLGLGYLAQWYPRSFPATAEIFPDLRAWSLPVTSGLPVLKQTFQSGWFLNGQTLYFTFLGISYFVSSEVALSVGFSPLALAAIGLLYRGANGAVLGDAVMSSMRSGSAVAYAVILAWTGRSYYGSVIRAAFFPRRRRGAA